jgi:hypothetical protein
MILNFETELKVHAILAKEEEKTKKKRTKEERRNERKTGKI